MLVRTCSNVVMLGLVASVSGCFSSWIPPEGSGADCPTRQTYWYDGDGDGWGSLIGADGEPAAPRNACEALGADRFTATNERDCDDDRAEVTGRVGGVCPVGMVPGASDTDFVGFSVVFESAVEEFVAFQGADIPLVSPVGAARSCELWGPTSGDLAPVDGPRLSGLPEWKDAFHARETLTQLYGVLCTATNESSETSCEASGGAGVQWDPNFRYAAYLNVKWQVLEGSWSPDAPQWLDLFSLDGTPLRGQWVWAASGDPLTDADGAPASDVLNEVPFCSGGYDPRSFFPALDASDIVDGQAIADKIDVQRLALIIADGEACIGVTYEAAPPDYAALEGAGVMDRPSATGAERYFWGEAHLMCQREAPLVETYAREGVFIDDEPVAERE